MLDKMFGCVRERNGLLEQSVIKLVNGKDPDDELASVKHKNVHESRIS